MIDRSGREWLTYAQAASRFDLDPALIRQWVRRGSVQSYRHRGRVAVLVQDVARAERSLRIDGANLGRGNTRRHAMHQPLAPAAESVTMASAGQVRPD